MEKTNIVLFPGWGFNTSVLKGLADRLSHQYQVSVIDLNTDESTWALPSRAILIGWSLGGLLAIKLAHQYPERFTKVITIATNPCFIAKPDWPGVSPEDFAEFEKSREAHPEKLLRQFALLQVNRQHYAEIKAFMVNPPLPPLDLLKQDLRETVKNFSNPLLFILGDDDKLVSPKIGQKINDLNPAIKVNTLKETGHMPFLVKLDEVMESIHDFL